jgi:hypothetical protein
MAYPGMGGSSSFQREQVAFPPLFTSQIPTSTSSSSSWHACAPGIDPSPSSQPFVDSQFDIFEWHAQYQSCVRYFLDFAQHSSPVQAVAAFVNIQLPFQRPVHPILSSTPAGSPPIVPDPSRVAGKMKLPMGPLSLQHPHPAAYVALVPYIRRLVATGFDFPGVLHGFFGDDWVAGVGRMHETERRNYLFAAKSDNWLKVKADYDMSDNQTIPFLQPLQNVAEKEIVSAESKWSEWLAMQDWMLGPRSPVDVAGAHGGVNVKREEGE